MGNSIRSLLRRTSSCHQPWQLSAALALGVVCGLLPKFSLLFGVIVVVCCGLPIHLPLAAASCFVFSLFAGSLAQVAGRAGLWSLTHPSLIDMWSSLDSLPWLPWIGLNNTVVHGSLLIGLGMALPVFFLTKPLAARLSPASPAVSIKRIDPDFAHELKPVVAVDWSGSVALDARSQPTSVSLVNEDTCHELEKLLATCNADQAINVDAAQVAQRAAQMVQYVDELLASPELQPAPSIAQTRVDVPAAAVQPGDFQLADVGQGTSAALHRHSGAAEVAARRPVGNANQAETLRYLLDHLRAIKDKV